jgi:Cytochrome P460
MNPVKNEVNTEMEIGWGWSWFDGAAPSKTTSTNYKVDCQSCHVPARASDWIYVQGYPALKK